jgi:hypothetical protein
VWVVFEGYQPEKGTSIETTTFNELEVWSVLSGPALSEMQIRRTEDARYFYLVL